MKRFDLIPYFFFVASLLIIVAIAFWAGDKTKSPANNPANITDNGNPGTISFDQKDFYLSPLAKINQKEIQFYNSGQGTLIVRAITTSTTTISTKINTINSSGATDFDSVMPKAIPAGEGGSIQVKFEKEFDWNNLKSQTIQITTNDPANPVATLNFFVADTNNNLN